MSSTRPMVSWRRAAGPFCLALLLTACSPGTGAEGTEGSPGVGDPYFPRSGNGGYDVKHYSLTLAYAPRTGRLTAKAVITATATQPLTSFHLDLKGMEVKEVEVEGVEVEGVKAEGTRAADWTRKADDLRIHPADTLPEGRTFRTTVTYAGTPRTITDPDGSEEGWLRTADGALALGEPTGSMAWFPGNHHPSDKASYDIEVTVPKGLTAVSNGELRSRRTEGGRTSFTWHTAEPMPSYAATLAIGDYTVTRSTLPSGLPVYTAVDPTQVARSRAVLARLPEIMDWAQYNFGPYPFSSTGAIIDRPEDSGYALETQNRPVFPGTPDTVTLVHELAHQWFGDSVTPKTWRDMWLNEGFATYAEWLWTEDQGGETAEQTFTALHDHGEDTYKDLWSFPPSSPTTAAQISAAPVYQRGAMVIHRIRRTVGDVAFYDIVQGWTATHRHTNASTADFTAYVEHMAPDKDFTSLWANWLYGTDRPSRP